MGILLFCEFALGGSLILYCSFWSYFLVRLCLICYFWFGFDDFGDLMILLLCGACGWYKIGFCVWVFYMKFWLVWMFLGLVGLILSISACVGMLFVVCVFHLCWCFILYVFYWFVALYVVWCCLVAICWNFLWFSVLGCLGWVFWIFGIWCFGFVFCLFRLGLLISYFVRLTFWDFCWFGASGWNFLVFGII